MVISTNRSIAIPHRHKFFEIINVDNDRLDHLGILGRFLLLEENEGPAELGKTYFY